MQRAFTDAALYIVNTIYVFGVIMSPLCQSTQPSQAHQGVDLTRRAPDEHGLLQWPVILVRAQHGGDAAEAAWRRCLFRQQAAAWLAGLPGRPCHSPAWTTCPSSRATASRDQCTGARLGGMVPARALVEADPGPVVSRAHCSGTLRMPRYPRGWHAASSKLGNSHAKPCSITAYLCQSNAWLQPQSHGLLLHSYGLQ